MKIVYLVTSSGGSFYCTNCYRDMLFLKAIKKYSNADAETVSLYLPPEKIYVENGFGTDVFFGAVSLYIREKIPALEKMPTFLEKIFDSPPMLNIAAKSASSTRTNGLEEMTLGMIDSSSRKHIRELENLVKYLQESVKPDIIHLSNSLIIGLAKQIKDYLDVKIVCSLQNEDDWINEMKEPYQSKAWEMIGKESVNVDAFISPSKYFSDFIVSKTNINRDKIKIVPIGIESETVFPGTEKVIKPAIGFLSRVSYNNGFDKLVDAFIKIRKSGDFENLNLHICGGYTGDDKPFIKKQIKKINGSGYKNSVRIFQEFQGKGKREFLESVCLISVPVRKPDAYGLYVLEANAAGVPVVQPSTGSFPEILEATEGGILYEPDTVEYLTENILNLLRNSDILKELGLRGKKNVLTKLSTEQMAKALMEVYTNL
ncbi:MAG: glycosyltransferase family 4 protein [Bacteroidales bacterium]|nr:glycosyltransferase family 4 protein [Bacteroidales bacterium]